MAKVSDVKVTTRDGVCPSVLAVPDGDGEWPAVIIYMDAGGVRPAFRDMAAQLADLGYVAIVPELYYRHGDYEPFKLPDAFSDEGERARLFSLVRSLTKAMAMSDTEAVLDFLAERPEVAGSKVGTTGYCMGGGISLTAAGTFPDRVAAAASFHGGHLVTEAPDSPHTVAGRIAGRVYIAAAEKDDTFPASQAEALEQALGGAGVDYRMETYPALHGFAVPDNPTFDEAAAERHWKALAELYGAALN